MVAHIGYGVADASLTTTQRGCFAQMEIMQQGVLRHVNANRCGELTDVKEDGVSINPDVLIGRVAVDAKKAQDKMYDKPFCAVKRTFTGFEYGPTLFHSLKGVTHLGFLVRDLSAPSANPFEEGCTFIDKPMDRNRTLRMLGHLLRAHVTYPDGRKQRPTNLERLVHLGVQAARHVLPAAAGARFEPRASARACLRWSAPPYTATERSGLRFVNFWASSSICEASSRVGAMMTARGLAAPGWPTVVPPAAGDESDEHTGMRKAAVLPEPVGAHASTSRPPMSSGTACICTRVSSW